MKKSEKNPEENSKTGKNINPLSLALETSGRIGSVALGAGKEILAEKKFSSPLKHSSEIFPTINQILEQIQGKPKDIQHIFISIGPGSFTGLRIAVTAAKMINLANSVKIIGVDTLDVIAENGREFILKENINADKLAVVLDAKRKQFFTAVYEWNNGMLEKCMDDHLIKADEFIESFCGKTEKIVIVGEGLVRHRKKFEHENIIISEEKYWVPKASTILKLGNRRTKQKSFEDVMSLEPRYLRKPEAEEKWELRHKS